MTGLGEVLWVLRRRFRPEHPTLVLENRPRHLRRRFAWYALCDGTVGDPVTRDPRFVTCAACRAL